MRDETRCLVVRPECRLSRLAMPFVQTGTTAPDQLERDGDRPHCDSLTMSRVDDLHRDETAPGTLYLLIFRTVRHTWYSTLVI